MTKFLIYCIISYSPFRKKSQVGMTLNSLQAIGVFILEVFRIIIESWSCESSGHYLGVGLCTLIFLDTRCVLSACKFFLFQFWETLFSNWLVTPHDFCHHKLPVFVESEWADCQYEYSVISY